MVADSPENIQSKSVERLSANQVNIFHAWQRPLQKALTLEAENEFENFLGRKEYFNTFVSRQLNQRPDFLSTDFDMRLKKLVAPFNDYDSLTASLRRRLVIDLRQFLHALSRYYSDRLIPKEPHLKIRQNNISRDKKELKNQLRLSLDSPIGDIPGIGNKLEEKFLNLGIVQIKDLFLYYPRDYVDYSCLRRISELISGETATVVATVRKCNSFISPRNSNLSILNLQLQDSSGRIQVTRFFAGRRFSNMAYLKSQESLYPRGSTVAVSGLVKVGSHGKSLNDPIIEVLDSPNAEVKSSSIGRLIPIYSLTEGLASERFRKFLEYVLPLSDSWIDPLPKQIIEDLAFPSKGQALMDLHCPSDTHALKLARRRLVFDEFFAFQLGLLLRRYKLRTKFSSPLQATNKPDGLVNLFLDSLPFSLTNAQRRVLNEIEADLSRDEPMCRLLQGDVGSGKTLVAVVALLIAVESGWQGTLMAPTEVLAEQHYRNLSKWLPQLHVTVELLTGSTSRRRRREILDNLAGGTLKILVGTHALIEDPVLFARLGLVVVDEQHRFGVRQRNLLLDKGLQPHLLTMTATPIPRTLALSLHGDLEVSQIDELPPGRSPVVTKLFSRSRIDKVYQIIRDEVERGQQAYIVLPLVEESEKLELSSAIQVHAELSKDIFPELNVALLHGRMSGHDKQDVINKFLNKKFDILVSTTVVEVGVDIPNASIMVIDNADRFGLSQLHQLRGRVGRGDVKSQCILIYDGKQTSSKQRLEFLVGSNDGFEISEIDLKLRGPGQVLGTKQSGLPDFALASLIDDTEVLELARSQAINLLSEDPKLLRHPGLEKWVNECGILLRSSPHLN